MKQLALKLAHLLALGKMQPLVVLPFGQLDLQQGLFLDLYPHLEWTASATFITYASSAGDAG